MLYSEIKFSKTKQTFFVCLSTSNCNSACTRCKTDKYYDLIIFNLNHSQFLITINHCQCSKIVNICHGLNIGKNVFIRFNYDSDNYGREQKKKPLNPVKITVIRAHCKKKKMYSYTHTTYIFYIYTRQPNRNVNVVT